MSYRQPRTPNGVILSLQHHQCTWQVAFLPLLILRVPEYYPLRNLVFFFFAHSFEYNLEGENPLKIITHKNKLLAILSALNTGKEQGIYQHYYGEIVNSGIGFELLAQESHDLSISTIKNGTFTPYLRY